MVLRVTRGALRIAAESEYLTWRWAGERGAREAAATQRDVALLDNEIAAALTRAERGARRRLAPSAGERAKAMSPAAMTHEEFEDLVRDAMDTLPDWAIPILEELAVLVEDTPPPGSTRPGTTLLGLYRGIPVTAHGGRVPGSMPGTITLYRLPILSACASRVDVAPRVLKVLGHEVGHAMGLPEAQLRELGWF